jgi:hypothetical protein
MGPTGYQPEKVLFALFSRYCGDGPMVEDIFYWGSLTEQKRREKFRCYYNRGHRQKQFCSGHGRGWTTFYFEEAKDWRFKALKGTIRKFLKVLAVHCLGLSDTLVRMSL